MKAVFKHFNGDKGLWVFVAAVAIFSFMPVFSASTNLVYVVGNGSTMGHFLKHAFMLFMGFVIMFTVHRVPYRYFSGWSVILWPVMVLLLIYTLFQGNTIGGANASRWLRLPFLGVGFQTSTLAAVILLIYVARYLSKNKDKEIVFKRSLFELWTPVALTLMPILPANFSTTALIFFMVLVVVFIGGYPKRFIGFILGAGILFLVVFVGLVKIFPEAMPNRVNTWQSRIESFTDENAEDGYQIEKAKIAIATGGLSGKGPGKSVQKNFLPQSTSDFIFAIIIEEFGLVGGFSVIVFYFLILYRIFVIANKAGTVFGTLLVVSVGLPIIFQALINMAVATSLFPVTGQTLPLISSGGTSIWITCFALGIVLSVSSANSFTEDQLAVENDDPLVALQETKLANN
jgi:cell division protein FtsW